MITTMYACIESEYMILFFGLFRPCFMPPLIYFFFCRFDIDIFEEEWILLLLLCVAVMVLGCSNCGEPSSWTILKDFNCVASEILVWLNITKTLKDTFHKHIFIPFTGLKKGGKKTAHFITQHNNQL